MQSTQNSWEDIAGEENKDTILREMYHQHREELCCYIVRKFDTAYSEAEDMVHTAFSRLVAHETPLSLENPRAFLYTAVHNIAIDLKRRNKVRVNYANAVNNDSAYVTDTPGPERTLECNQHLNLIATALWGMPKKRRQLLMMSRFDGLSYAEIARRVGLSESVVRKHISKALADCHKALREKQP
jgi:RNA polymerase sigma factor (sigma-70 family)